MASDESTVATLPGLEPSMMSPTGTVTDEEANSTAKKTSANSDKNKHPAREPNLLFAVAKNVVRATTMKKPAAGTITSPNATGEGNGSVRMMFGKFRRSEASKLDVQASDQGFQPVEQQPQAPEDQSSNQQPANKATKEFQPDPAPSTASADTDDRVHSDSQATAGPGLVDNVRDTLERLVVQLDSVDPRKLLAVRLGGELRGLLGKAQDEFAAYEAEFVEHVSNEGVSVSLRNFSASLMQVPAIAERLRTAKFMLNRTFKREVLFAFQEINSYYTSLFMELSMAVARRSGIELPLPAPVAPPPEPEHPAPSGDEICLDAHQHFFGHGVTKNLRKALELYEQAANLSCAVAMTCLGQMHFCGQGTEKDLLIAEKWFELAVSAGEIEPCYQLGLLLCEKADHVQNDQQKDEFFSLARVRFSQAAEQNHADAQYELGIFYEHGRGGCTVDETQAATWYTKAAEQGHTAAEASLGRLFLVGAQIQQDVAKAVHYLQKAAAKNDPSAQTRLGVLYTTGNGVKQDMERGVAFLEKAADSGSCVAMTRLANFLLLHTPASESNISIPPSFSAHFRDREEIHDEALRLLLDAGNGGHIDAYYALGKLLESSSLLRDKAAALRFYSKAATAPTPHTAAAKRVATMQYSGIGCTADKHKAHRFYSIAANAGDAEALNSLGLMFEEGDGCDLNFVKAAECYRTAAGLGSPHAHFNLGCLLSHGKGVARNVDAAQAHFRKAIELGYSLAQQYVLQDDVQ